MLATGEVGDEAGLGILVTSTVASFVKETLMIEGTIHH